MPACKRFVYAASSSAYGDQPTLPKVETMRPEPLSPYAAAKLTGEYYCRAFQQRLRSRNILAALLQRLWPASKSVVDVLGRDLPVYRCLMTGKQPVIYGDGEQTRDFTYIANVVDANIKAARRQRPGGFGERHTTSPTASGYRLLECCKTIKRIAGKPDVAADYQPERTGDVKHSQADNRKAVEILGYESLLISKRAFARTIEWWQSSRSAAVAAA